VLDWFKRYNEGRAYAEEVKPFNFLLTFFTRRQEDVASEDLTHEFDPKLDGIRPVAPYEKDSEKALQRVFDRNSETLAPVPKKWLRTVADVLRDYHRQPEYKLLMRHRRAAFVTGYGYGYGYGDGYKPLRHPQLRHPQRSACLSRASGWSSLTSRWGFPCCARFPCVRAAANTPVQRLGVVLAHLTQP
jgi:hypothetical protein